MNVIRTSIIIAVDNHYELINNFFEHLLEEVDTTNCELIVAFDHCQNIEVLQYICGLDSRFKQMKTITIAKKVGYAIANNMAVNEASGEYLVFMNTDVFPQKNAIQQLVSFVETHPSPCIAQGLLLYPQTNRIQSTGHIFGEYFNRHALVNRMPSELNMPKVISRQALTSAFYAMKKELFCSLGAFDSFYYNCWDGMEFSLRAHFNQVATVCITDIIAFHSTGGARNYIYNDETQQSAYFWSNWGKRTINDLQYEIQKNHEAFSNKYYTLINCTSIRHTQKYFEGLDISISEEIVTMEKKLKINLYNELPYSMLSQNEAIIFFTNNFMDLLGNKNWFKVRNNDIDVVVDTNGNVFLIREMI